MISDIHYREREPVEGPHSSAPHFPQSSNRGLSPTAEKQAGSREANRERNAPSQPKTTIGTTRT
jgi:hypothetical protein